MHPYGGDASNAGPMPTGKGLSSSLFFLPKVEDNRVVRVWGETSACWRIISEAVLICSLHFLITRLAHLDIQYRAHHTAEREHSLCVGQDVSREVILWIDNTTEVDVRTTDRHPVFIHGFPIKFDRAIHCITRFALHLHE